MRRSAAALPIVSVSKSTGIQQERQALGPDIDPYTTLHATEVRNSDGYIDCVLRAKTTIGLSRRAVVWRAPEISTTQSPLTCT